MSETFGLGKPPYFERATQWPAPESSPPESSRQRPTAPQSVSLVQDLGAQ